MAAALAVSLLLPEGVPPREFVAMGLEEAKGELEAADEALAEGLDVSLAKVELLSAPLLLPVAEPVLALLTLTTTVPSSEGVPPRLPEALREPMAVPLAVPLSVLDGSAVPEWALREAVPLCAPLLLLSLVALGASEVRGTAEAAGEPDTLNTPEGLALIDALPQELALLQAVGGTEGVCVGWEEGLGVAESLGECVRGALPVCVALTHPVRLGVEVTL